MLRDFTDRLRRQTFDRAAWRFRHHLPGGSERGLSPRGRWLSRSDLPAHPAVDYRPIYPEERIPFTPLDLPREEWQTIEEASRRDDWTNEIRPGFVARVAQGRLVARDFVVTPNDDFYSELRFPHSGYFTEAQLEPLRFPRYGRPEKLSGRALVLYGVNNLYHFIFEAVGRLALARAAGHDPRQFETLIGAAPRTRFEHDLYAAMGLDPSRLLDPSHLSHLQFDELVFSNTTYGVPAELCRLIVNELSGLVPQTPAAGLPKRIYIPRRTTKHRRILNEPEVEQLMLRRGFTLFSPESHTLAEQRAVFAHAEVIVTPHGAALTNLLWCKPGSTVIEIRNPRHTLGYWKLYWNIGSVMDLRYHWLNGKVADGETIDPQYQDITIPLDRLAALIDQID